MHMKHTYIHRQRELEALAKELAKEKSKEAELERSLREEKRKEAALEENLLKTKAALEEDDSHAPPARNGFAAVAGFVREVQPAGASLTVVRTSAGAAQSVAIVLDRARWPEVVGTISGDDTIFVATANAAAQRKLLSRLHDTFQV